MKPFKTISEIIFTNSIPDNEDSVLCMYTDFEVRTMMYEASKQGYEHGRFDSFRSDAPVSIDEFLTKINE